MPFHFCGMVLDYARHCCKSGFKLWQDDDTIVPGRWFRAEPGAKLLEGYSPFRKWSTWEVGESNAGLGEQVTQPKLPPYDKGANPLGYDGQRHCGSLDAMLRGGIHGVDEALVTDAAGSLACCFGPPPLEPPFRWVPGNPGFQGVCRFVAPAGIPRDGRLVVLALHNHMTPAASPAPTVPGLTLIGTATFLSGTHRISLYAGPYADPLPSPLDFGPETGTTTVAPCATAWIWTVPSAHVESWSWTPHTGAGFWPLPEVSTVLPGRWWQYAWSSIRATAINNTDPAGQIPVSPSTPPTSFRNIVGYTGAAALPSVSPPLAAQWNGASQEGFSLSLVVAP